MKFVVKTTEPRNPEITRPETYFVLVADNGEPVATSETYVDQRSALDTIDAIRRRAAGATIEMETT